MMEGEATRKVTDFESQEEMCANVAVRLGRCVSGETVPRQK